ncbi:MAG: hypothetical protein JJ863_27200 [Deltaproteobacteria bacterium]|nr:hypothetical protein [Deltaproteobacteria bacterium]
MSLSQEEIIRRAALEVADASTATSHGPLATAARRLTQTPEGNGVAEVLLVDVTRLSSAGVADVPVVTGAKRVVGITLAFDACTTDEEHGVRLDRLIGPFGVVDVTSEGLVIVEVALGVSARDLQEQSTAELLAGPSLGPVRRAPDPA